uniref:Uncharacterized protein n=1 Tax=Arundo donax TaxID=35708 RepID=A0A0A8Y1I4_ARUDO
MYSSTIIHGLLLCMNKT